MVTTFLVHSSSLLYRPQRECSHSHTHTHSQPATAVQLKRKNWNENKAKPSWRQPICLLRVDELKIWRLASVYKSNCIRWCVLSWILFASDGMHRIDIECKWNKIESRSLVCPITALYRQVMPSPRIHSQLSHVVHVLWFGVNIQLDVMWCFGARNRMNSNIELSHSESTCIFIQDSLKYSTAVIIVPPFSYGRNCLPKIEGGWTPTFHLWHNQGHQPEYKTSCWKIFEGKENNRSQLNSLWVRRIISSKWMIHLSSGRTSI